MHLKALLCPLLGTQMGGLGSVAAPGFLLLGFATGATFVPFLVFGSAVCVAGFAMPVLPETLDAPAPETVQARPMLRPLACPDYALHFLCEACRLCSAHTCPHTPCMP
jgi:hypothetical protein